jgi:O-antigen ligase
VLLVPIAVITGKDSTFTARTQIWELIRAHIQYSPIIGSGYGGYWAGPMPSSPSYIFLQVMYFYPSEAHNGYLDIINDLGYVGLLLLLGYLIGYIKQALKLLKVNYTQSALYLALIFQQLLTNLSETHWLFVGHDFIVLTMATFGLARSLMDASPARRRT